MCSVIQLYDQVYLLKDKADCFSTLVIGKEKALVFDTGCGISDLKKTIRVLTDLPLVVICSHAHFDHIGGSYQFDEVFLSKEDRNILNEYNETLLNRWLCEMNDNKEVFIPFNNWNNVKDICFDAFDLGNLECQMIMAPGHSAGSITILIPSLNILLSGDALLPIITFIFPNHGSLQEYKSNLLKLKNLNFEYYITSHSNRLYPKSTIDRMIDCIDRCKDKKFYEYEYPLPPHSKGYFYLDSIEDPPVGIIIESMKEL